MNFSEVVKTLNQASTFELCRLKIAIEGLLAEPSRTEEIRNKLSIGQQVSYFNEKLNKSFEVTVIALERTKLKVQHLVDKEIWTIAYISVDLQGIDTSISNQSKRGLTRNELAIGDLVGFRDKQGREWSGHVLRLNPKSVSVMCQGNHQWKVSYSLLYRVMETEGVVYDPKLIEG